MLSKVSAVGHGTETPLKSHSKLYLRTPFRKWVLVPTPGSLNLGGSAKASVPINTSSSTYNRDSRGWKLLSEQVGHLAFQRLLQSPLCSHGVLSCDALLGCSLVMFP